MIIYNKGEKLGWDNEIPLENVGREGHTYYTYIYDNYDTLDDYTVFLQRNPFDHCSNIIKNLHILKNAHLKFPFAFLSEWVIHSNMKYLLRTTPRECAGIFQTYFRIFGTHASEDKEIIFGVGAQFIVSKESILKNSKAFYLNIIKCLYYSICPNEVYDLERFHQYLFV